MPVRKPGKLPFKTHAFRYDLEYGSDTLHIHIDGLSVGQRVLIVDDLLATGGTVEACCRLVEKAGAVVVGAAFVIELSELGGAARLAAYHPQSLIRYQRGAEYAGDLVRFAVAAFGRFLHRRNRL